MPTGDILRSFQIAIVKNPMALGRRGWGNGWDGGDDVDSIGSVGK